MTALITLESLNDNYHQESYAYNLDDKNCFTYLDEEKMNCEICVYDDGICLFRQCPDHLLELHLADKKYAKIYTDEGFLQFDVKVVDFKKNSDILLMRYILNDEERTITIKYY